ncbi:glycosyltransferase [Desulfovibrio aminophilus]|uniref:glycosyltransferase family 4 protein n=1 Tax=Desulfovibrio aminophilus TaxID=81425 RepID=UPI00339508F1
MTLDILFLTQSGETLPSVRFRVLPLVADGSARGLAVDWRPVPKFFLRRLFWLARLPRSTVVVVQKKLFSTLELAVLRKRCDRLAFDYDDALWAAHPGESLSPASARRLRKARKRFARMIPAMDVVLAASAHLAGEALKLRSKVVVAPTAIDTEVYTPPASRPAPADGCPLVGWMGATWELSALDEVLKSLEPHAERLRLNVVAERRFAEKCRTLADLVAWSPEDEVALLREMDIGLHPLGADEYRQGKCGFRLLRCMACGVVPVASAVGVNLEIVEHGRDGFLVERPEQWAEYVLRLADDPGLRADMARAAREKVERIYHRDILAERYWAALGFLGK